MHPSFRELFDQIESQRKALLDSVNSLTAHQMNASPSAGKWCVSQILSHLITGERMSLLYIQKKIQGIVEAPDSGIWEEVKIVLLIASQRLPGLKLKAPLRVVESTILYRDLPTITREWDRVRAEFRSLLEKIPDEHVKRRIYRHARAGYLNTRHALIFFREHIIHHAPQIKRLVKHK